MYSEKHTLSELWSLCLRLKLHLPGQQKWHLLCSQACREDTEPGQATTGNIQPQDAAATALAKDDTDEAMQQLEEILCYMQLAAGVAQPPIIKLLSRSARDVSKWRQTATDQNATLPAWEGKEVKKPTQDLHEELRQLRGSEGNTSGDRILRQKCSRIAINLPSYCHIYFLIL
ncbi:hypothetical protein COOONC_09794 [Cooperia oncophora]